MSAVEPRTDNVTDINAGVANPAEYISADELAYLQTTQRDVEMATAVQQSYLRYLSARYRLLEGDVLNTDSGTITRRPDTGG